MARRVASNCEKRIYPSLNLVIEPQLEMLVLERKRQDQIVPQDKCEPGLLFGGLSKRVGYFGGILL